MLVDNEAAGDTLGCRLHVAKQSPQKHGNLITST